MTKAALRPHFRTFNTHFSLNPSTYRSRTRHSGAILLLPYGVISLSSLQTKGCHSVQSDSLLGLFLFSSNLKQSFSQRCTITGKTTRCGRTTLPASPHQFSPEGATRPHLPCSEEQPQNKVNVASGRFLLQFAPGFWCCPLVYLLRWECSVGLTSSLVNWAAEEGGKEGRGGRDRCSRRGGGLGDGRLRESWYRV